MDTELDTTSKDKEIIKALDAFQRMLDAEPSILTRNPELQNLIECMQTQSEHSTDS